MMLKITLEYDLEAENPCEIYDLTVHSFSPKHINYMSPEKVGIYSDFDGDPELSSRDENGKPNKYKKLFDSGFLFPLSCYQNGNILWSLKGEGPQCRFDTAPIAGIIILDKDKWKGRHWKTKEDVARSFLKIYSDWCNGLVYQYRIEEQDGSLLDSCCGYYDARIMFSDISVALPSEAMGVEFEGECAWLSNHYSLDIPYLTVKHKQKA